MLTKSPLAIAGEIKKINLAIEEAQQKMGRTSDREARSMYQDELSLLKARKSALEWVLKP